MARFRRLSLAVAFVAPCAAALAFAAVREDGLLHVHFLDVGQGDAIYVRAPNGRDMLIDAGIGSGVLRRLAEAMPFYDRSIDVVLATHPDADHIGGIPHVLSRYRVGRFVESGVESKNAVDDEIHRLLREKGVERVLARRGMVIDMGSGAYFQALFPEGDPAGMETNDASIVGVLRYGDTAFVLTGDSPSSVERMLVAASSTLRADVLKAGHHGSKTSSSEGFVRAVAPRWAVISSGCDNRYGHPHKDVINTFERLAVEVVGTCGRGTIRFESDGREVALTE